MELNGFGLWACTKAVVGYLVVLGGVTVAGVATLGAALVAAGAIVLAYENMRQKCAPGAL
jgi:hypothetical protein